MSENDPFFKLFFLCYSHASAVKEPKNPHENSALVKKSLVLYLTTTTSVDRRMTQVSRQDWPFGVYSDLQQNYVLCMCMMFYFPVVTRTLQMHGYHI